MRKWILLTILLALTGLSFIAVAQAHPPANPVPSDARVDINHADVQELVKVPGLTRTWAERIVRYRPYRAKNDLLDKGIVSNEVYGRIKNYVIARREKP